MDFQQAVIFLAAVVVIVAAGAVLGAALRGRGVQQLEQAAHDRKRKADLYAELIGALDAITEADDRHKQWFIHRYYQALVYAPDRVVKSLNRYLDGVTAMGADLSPDRIMELRGEVIREMRGDVLAAVDKKSKLAVAELYKLEVKPNEPPAPPKPGKGHKSDATQEPPPSAPEPAVAGEPRPAKQPAE